MRFLVSFHAEEQSCADPEGETRVRTTSPWKNHKTTGFLINIGPDPTENHKATKPTFNVGPHSQFKWRFAGGPMMTGFEWYLDPLSPH